MSNEGFSQYLEPVVSLSEQAAHAILEIYNTDFDVEHKKDNTPLTKADMAAHRIIVDGLKKLTPEVPVLSEESAAIPFEQRQQWSRYWLVDPLDGTREFIKRNGEFTVNIALIDENYPVLGVIYVPVTGVCYYAAEGKGAYKIDENKQRQSINSRSIDLQQLVVAGSRSHFNDRLTPVFADLPDYELIPMGSSLKSCLVAEGKADIYPRLGPTSEWDTGAAQAIVEAAGGRLTNLNIERLPYNTKSSLLNPEFIVIGDESFDWGKYFKPLFQQP
ncbi:MAG: 3'(2'),5'-bisphosphate nucleotidase CysQ [Gammaproteobacteria bacterium]|nr:3'(2'),5'-bisphosphate nucleotidase CysQ [Gammaproteobacteria bacterium]MDH5727797.1 3'(2'),5'-bisphosphate nucleotidase CysQ [Gammaproteobacteria bacterium]